ncbi:hypothetical protein ACIRL2_41275 [Embleya sp. NPDC127516]|uniref:hypothetical protein n=1 Tax=Embleya sp. NPDC127516 TaxID=3363990 RepID=UPI00380499AE
MARTTAGRQCRNPLEYGQVLNPMEVQRGDAGYVYAYMAFAPNRKEQERWLAQHCATHDGVDVTPPEIRPFRLATDEALVQQYRHDALVD